MTTLRFRLLDVPVAIEALDPEAEQRLATCYAACPPDAGAAEPLRATLERSGGDFRAAVEGREPSLSTDLVTAVRALNHELMHALMLRVRSNVYVHAAVVEHAGRAIVLPGISRAGKSTLALALVRAGARYLSDELLVYEPATGMALPYPRAVKIRDCCLHYFADLGGAFVGEGEGRYLSPAGLAPGGVGAAAPLGAVVLARWDPDRPPDLVPVSGGRAFLALGASALNFGSHGARTIDHLAELVGAARTFASSWTEPHGAARLILEAAAG